MIHLVSSVELHPLAGKSNPLNAKRLVVGTMGPLRVALVAKLISCLEIKSGVGLAGPSIPMR
jgi:hypothetical protein